MDTVVLDLIWLSPKTAQISVKMLSRDKDGRTLLLSDCVSFDELNEQIDLLIRDLEIIRQEGRAEYGQ